MSQRRVMFLRNYVGTPIGCVAITLSRSKGVVEYQVSVLNPADRFNRAVARQLAYGRLVEQPLSVPIKKECSMHDVSHAVMTGIASNPNLPSRAIKAAKLWLKSNYSA